MRSPAKQGAEGAAGASVPLPAVGTVPPALAHATSSAVPVDVVPALRRAPKKATSAPVEDRPVDNGASLTTQTHEHAQGCAAVADIEQPDAEYQTAARPRRRPRGRSLAYMATAAVAVFALAVLLPQYVADRPDGGFVTGNEAAQPEPSPTGTARPPRDLSKVTEAEMEAVIDANPEVVGMRLALARRYLDKEQYDKAAEHYGEALKQDPGNPDVQGQSGWLLFKMGRPAEALRFVDRALQIDPGSQDRLWFRANILLEGRNDPAGALEVLRELEELGNLPADLRDGVKNLMATAERAGGR